MAGRIIQAVFGVILIAGGAMGIVPMLQTQQQAITMDGVLYLGAFLVGLDILGRSMRRE